MPDQFYDAVADWLIETGREPGVKRVLKVNQYERSGNCDTCDWSVTEVHIDYIGQFRDWNRYKYFGSMSGLIRELTND